MAKPPKMIPNPEYLASTYGQEELRQGKDALSQMGHRLEDFFPEEYGKRIPPEGAWIMILLSVHVGKQLPDGKVETVTVPHLSIWFAMPTLSNNSVPCGPISVSAHKAAIQTPQGEVFIWPHEYQIVDLAKYLDFTEEDGFYIHFMHPETQGFNEQKMFYLRSRGIPKAQAQRILLPELKDAHFCYFTFHEEYSCYFGDGCGVAILGRGRR